MNAIELLKKTCLCMVWMIVFTGIRAQTASPSLDKKVHISVKAVNIIALGNIITAQTGLILSFNAQRIIAQKQLWLPRPSYSIHQLLSMIKEATGAEYTIYREHIIFHRIANQRAVIQTETGNKTRNQVGSLAINQQQQKQRELRQLDTPAITLSSRMVQHHALAQPAHVRAKKSTVAGSHMEHEAAVLTAQSSNDSNNVPGDVPSINPTNAGADITDKVVTGNTDSTFVDNRTMTDKQPPYSLNYINTSTAIITAKPASPTLLTVLSPEQQLKQRHAYEIPGLFKPFVSTGIAADEVLYANFQARAGVTLLYGIAAWSTNFSASGFRYGAGSSYPFKNGWLIQLEATTGKLSKVTPILPDDTATVKYLLTTNSRLQRINLFAQKSIATHWSLYAGPVFNHLKSTYQSIIGQVSPATIAQRRFATEKEYTIIRPPYTLGSSPSEELADVKTWIGLQIGINYRF